jgi:heptosyltransferase-2
MKGRVLIIQTAAIGDVILMTALAETLHKAYPELTIDLLVKKGHESLFTEHPYLGMVRTWDKKNGKYVNLVKLIMEIRKTKYRMVINVQRFFATGLITAFSGAKETRGFAKNPLSIFFTRRFKHPIGDGRHETERNHQLITDHVPNSYTPVPKLYPPKSAMVKVGGMVNGPAITISPASLWFTKQFPAERWIELIRFIPTNYKIFLLGGPSDHHLCDMIIQGSGHPGTVNLAGKFTLPESAALMSLCRMNFTNDSSPMHLASAVNAPVTAVFCSTIPGFGFGPLSDDQSIVEVSQPLTCRPCGLHGKRMCPEKHFRCALGIDIDRLRNRIPAACKEN